MKKIFTILFFSALFAFSGSAQEEKDSVKYTWGLYGNVQDSVEEPSGEIHQLKMQNVKNGQEGKINVYAPTEIKSLTEKLKAIDEPKAEGYRVQIKISQDKNEVLKAQSEFLKYTQDVEVYIDRKAPNYRLRVGDFYSKFDAHTFQRKIKAQYPSAIVVSDEIHLPKFKLETPQNDKE